MFILRDPALASTIADPALRGLVEERFVQICEGEPYDFDQHGYMLVVQPGDTVAALEEESSCSILRNLFDNARWGDPDFLPSFEYLQEYAGCYEMVFIVNDSSFGIDFFIPKAGGIDAELLAMCAEYAEPAPEMSRPRLPATVAAQPGAQGIRRRTAGRSKPRTRHGGNVQGHADTDERVPARNCEGELAPQLVGSELLTLLEKESAARKIFDRRQAVERGGDRHDRDVEGVVHDLVERGEPLRHEIVVRREVVVGERFPVRENMHLELRGVEGNFLEQPLRVPGILGDDQQRPRAQG
jgi:hypothetical protein